MIRLWEHQKRILLYQYKTPHPALFCEMRTGKTLPTICRYRGLGRRVLVVAPNSALMSWEEQLGQVGEEFYLLNEGRGCDRLKVLQEWQTGWYLLNKEGHQSVPEVGEMEWDAVILDESTFIKTPWKHKGRGHDRKILNFTTYFYCTHFREVGHRVIMTGTPNPESLLDYFCQFLFLHGTAFGHDNFWHFRQKYFRVDYVNRWIPYLRTERKIGEYVARNAFVLKRSELGLEAKRVFETRVISPPASIQKTRKMLEKEMVLEYKGTEVASTLFSGAQYVWLRKLASGFVNDKLVWKGKMNEVISLLSKELRGDLVIVWAVFTCEIDELRRLLAKNKISCGVINGKVPNRERIRLIHKQRAGEKRVLIIHPSCGEFGLNLSHCDTAIYLSAPVQYSSWDQTLARISNIHRKSPNLYLLLKQKNSIDESIYCSLREKEDRVKMGHRIIQDMKRRINGR